VVLCLFLNNIVSNIHRTYVLYYHSAALAALHHHKRLRRDDKTHHQQAEKLLLQAIARDDMYLPAYLSLAALYIYRMKQPQRALPLLQSIKNRRRGSSDDDDNHQVGKIEALLVDAQALAEGGNDNMVTPGAVMAEQDHLAALAMDSNHNWFFQQQQQQQPAAVKATTKNTTTTTKSKTTTTTTAKEKVS
jgi:hypothetical protein